ncbi:hypothetical protein ACTFIY_008491 [Dictyostelium cf. discoideum]
MTSLNSSINSNSENPTICFCSLKAIEKKCDECSYMLSKEVKQINAYLYQNQMQLFINLQQQQQNYIEEEKKKTLENYDDKYNNNLFEVENKKQYRKSVEICFCQCPAREIQCYGDKENKNNEISKLIKKSEKSNNEDKSSNENEPASEENDIENENENENENESNDENETAAITTLKKPPPKGAQKKQATKKNQIKKFIGLTSINFEKLYLMIKSELKDYEDKNKFLYDLKGRIFITLFYLRHYPKDIIIQYIFKISKNTLTNYLKEIIDIIYNLSQKSFSIFLKSKEEYYKDYIDRFNKNIRVYCVCDGSEQRIISPMDKEAKIIYFSGKKGYFSINKLVYCLPNGKIIHMAKSRPGARSDQGLIHEDSGFFNNFNGINEYIMGDKGFLGSDKVKSKFIIPELINHSKVLTMMLKKV